MAESHTCPSADELQRLVLGQLPDVTAQRIQHHLEECPECWSALYRYFASEELLEVVRAKREGTSGPTKTLYLPIDCLRGALSTWIRAHDRTHSNVSGLPFSIAEFERLLSPPQSADEIGRIAGFRVLRVLGVGGFAVVFEAEDIQLKRRVALKLMHPSVAAKHGVSARFLREAQSAAALKHEHVVTIYQVGVHGETPFIALELLHGETLEDYLIRKGRLSIKEVVRIGGEIASGLAAAHAGGLLHCDIKPANVWLEGPDKPTPNSIHLARHSSDSAVPSAESACFAEDGESAGKVKILDFGCAKSWADEPSITDRRLLIGTPAYMAPEQFSGDAVDPRADLFSLGCVLYRMAAGKRPFGGRNLFAVVRALALEDPAPLGAINPQVPGPLSDLVSKLLSKSPEDRPATAQVVLDELRSIKRNLLGQGVANPSGPSTGLGTGRKQRRLLLACVTVLALVLPFAYHLFGAQLIRIATNKGQIVIAVDDPTVTVQVQENQIVIHDGQGQAEITLAAGDHQFDVTVKQSAGESTFQTDKFTLRRGGTKVIEVQQELANAVALRVPALQTQPKSESSAASTELQTSQLAVDVDRRAALWVLSRGGTVTVRMGHQQFADVHPGQTLPTSEFELRSISLPAGALTTGGLERLHGLKDLVQLSLNGKQITGLGFESLQGLVRLKTLVLANTSVTDAALKNIQGLTQLNILSLENTQVTDVGLPYLAALKSLRELNLSWTHVTDAGLPQLRNLPQLEVLYVRALHLTDAGLSHLRDLTSLRSLSLGKQSLTDAGLVHLEGLNKLESLELDSTQITDAGLPHLAALKNLHDLNLSWTHLTDAGLAQLAKFPQLEGLYLRGLYLTDAGLVSLGAHKKLRSLYLSGQPVTNAGLAQITRLEGLQTLGLSSTQVTDAGLGDLRALKNLQDLNLDETRVTDAGLAHLKRLPELQVLNLGHTRVTAGGLTELQELKNLRILGLDGVTQVGDDAVPALLKLRSLVEIHLNGTRVSAKGFAALKTAFANPERITWSEPNVTAAKAVLAAGGSTEVRLDGAAADRSVNVIGELPSEPFRITAVSLAGVQSPLDEVFAALTDPGVDSLVSLDLSGTAIKDADWPRLKGLTHLRRLVLEGTALRESNLDQLRGLTNLEELVLSRTETTDAKLVPVWSLTKLKKLALDFTHVSDVSLAHLEGRTELKALGLRNTEVTDAGLKHLEGLTELESLMLDGTRVSNAGLTHLRRLTALQALSLSFTSVTDAGLTQLQGLSNLEKLTLNATQLSDEGLIPLQHFTKLHHLVVNRTRVSDAGLQHLEALPQLERLSLDETRVTDAGLVHLRGLRKLRFLSLNGLPVSDAGLLNLEPLTKLERLNLNGTRVTDKGLAYLKGLSGLDSLDLGATQVTEGGLTDLQVLKNLRVLGLKGLPQLSDVAIPKLLHFERLQEVDLRDTHVSANGFSILKASLPNSRIVWSEPNYSVATSVLTAGGTVEVRLEETPSEISVKAIRELPTRSFGITRIRLVGSQRTLGQLLSEIANPRLDAFV